MEPLDPIRLAAQYPAYDFRRVETHFGDQAICATARNFYTHPWCVVARDPDEIREQLGQPLRDSDYPFGLLPPAGQ